jgi:hypothetical protein
MSPPRDALPDQDQPSDIESFLVVTAPETVMAEQITHDVVDQTQSMSDASLVDVNANPSTTTTAGNGQANAHHIPDSHYSASNDPPTIAASFDVARDSSIAPSSVDAGSIQEAQRSDDVRMILPHQQGSLSSYVQNQMNHDPSSDHDEAVADQVIIVQEDMGDAVGVLDAATRGGALDASGGSDTETSKADSVEQREQGMGHVRSNSVKKPTTFKTVSVTKNFLAKSVAVGQASKAPGDKSE